MIRTNRKGLTFGTMVVAGVMVLASAAFACTTFKGTMTVTGNSQTPGTSTAVGKNSSMSHCSVTPGANATSGGSVTISSTATNLSGCASSTLNANTVYDVNFVGGKAFGKPNPGPTAVYQWLIDCMSPPGGSVKNLGTATTDPSGNVAATTYSLTPAGSLTNNNLGEDSAVCLSTPSGGNGNQAPVHIVSL